MEKLLKVKLTPFVWKMKDKQIRSRRSLFILRSLTSLWGHRVIQLWLRALVCDPDPLAAVRTIILTHLLGIKGILVVHIWDCLLHWSYHEWSRSCHVREKHLLLVLLGIYYYYR
jgi:hypothetical protein